MADKFCETKGFPKAADDSYAEVDAELAAKVKGMGYTFLKKMPK